MPCQLVERGRLAPFHELPVQGFVRRPHVAVTSSSPDVSVRADVHRTRLRERRGRAGDLGARDQKGTAF